MSSPRGTSAGYPTANTPSPQSVDQGNPLARDLFMRLMRPAAQLMISPSDPALTLAQQAAKHREELFSHVPHDVRKAKHSVRTLQHALADPNQTSTSPPAWLKDVDSKLLSERWPQIQDHRQAIATAAQKQSRLRQLELELQTPEARAVMDKLKERGALKKEICLSYTDMADRIFAEDDPDLWGILLEMYKQEVGEDLLEPHTPPDPPGFSTFLDELLS